MRETYGSPDKKARIENYMQSSGMKQTLSYNDNDATYGLVTTKPQNRGYIPPDSLKKETWKPKTTTKWVEGYRAPLTLQ